MDTGRSQEKALDKSYDRRDFFREAFRLAGRNVAQYIDSKVEEKKTQVDALTTTTIIKKPEFRSKRKDFLRPPGAHDEALFIEHCKTCNLCVSACPRSAIVSAGPEYGEAEGTPIIIPRRSPCVLCKDLLCTLTCKKGVLSPISDIHDVKMGIAYINERNCPAYDGVSNCSLCHIRCPLSDSAIYLDDFKPTVNKEACTGCGVCESACSTINTTPAIRVRPRILVGAGLGPPDVDVVANIAVRL
ncbi:MAG: 4Fe-4S dicluster domain-containing protein [Nitrospirota bacterium]|mgnify:FL=1